MKIIVGMKNSTDLAKNITKRIKGSYLELDVTSLSSGEVAIRFKKDIKNADLILVKSFYPNPDDGILEMILTCNTAYELGARSLTLVAPYLPYLHCDKRFSAGECLSNRVVARMLSCVDEIITVDPHLHRIDNLARIFKVKTKRLSANFAIASYIYRNFKNEVVIGPDHSAFPWAEVLTKHVEVKATVQRKGRPSARSVKIQVPKDVQIKNKNVAILDDTICTGNTMIQAIREVKKLRPRSISCICVHGLFSDNSVAKMKKAGVQKIIATNTVMSKFSKIDVSDVIARSLR